MVETHWVCGGDSMPAALIDVGRELLRFVEANWSRLELALQGVQVDKPTYAAAVLGHMEAFASDARAIGLVELAGGAELAAAQARRWQNGEQTADCRVRIARLVRAMMRELIRLETLARGAG